MERECTAGQTDANIQVSTSAMQSMALESLLGLMDPATKALFSTVKGTAKQNTTYLTVNGGRESGTLTKD